MAQPGDTITYTFSEERESEDISEVDEITIDYIDGAGGQGDVRDGGDGGAGGRVENAVADVSDYDTLYIWVGDTGADTRYGRYFGRQALDAGNGAGSSEVSVLGTDRDDSDTEPFIAAAGGGGGGGGGGSFGLIGRGGARGPGEGNAPPQGGSGGDADEEGEPGDGAVSGHSSDVPIIDAGATTEGGGAPTDTEGEIKITYKERQDPPEPPENLTAELL